MTQQQRLWRHHERAYFSQTWNSKVAIKRPIKCNCRGRKLIQVANCWRLDWNMRFISWKFHTQQDETNYLPCKKILLYQEGF